VDVETDGSAEVVLELLARLAAAGTPASALSTLRPSLDDVFLALTGTARADSTGPSAGDSTGHSTGMELVP
jgi:hypothetical protein